MSRLGLACLFLETPTVQDSGGPRAPGLGRQAFENEHFLDKRSYDLRVRRHAVRETKEVRPIFVRRGQTCRLLWEVC